MVDLVGSRQSLIILTTWERSCSNHIAGWLGKELYGSTLYRPMHRLGK